MLLVTSGAVALDRQVLCKEAMMTMTMRRSLSPKDILENSRVAIQRQTYAAFGQKGLMSFYERIRKNLQATLNELLNLNIISILNTNDVVAPCTDMDAEVTAAKDEIVINDNDSLATHLAVLISADLLLIMSDVNGLYTGPSELEGSRFLNTFCPKQDSQLITFGARSKVGTGGMESKVKCASWALDHEVGVVITNGQIDKAILNIIDTKKIGTVFRKVPNQLLPVDVQATKARDGSRLLQKLSSDQRKAIIDKIALSLNEYSKDILQANEQDLEQAKKGGQVVHRTRFADGLMLKQITTPISVLLVIFESRPDSLPQIAALSICSGNGLLLKDGSDAKYSNEILTQIIQDALETYVSREIVALGKYYFPSINTREQVSDFLHLRKYNDLVIPRSSNELVRSVQKQSVHIPVLGHAEGLCHVYVDKDANLDMALRIVRDSKCDYPSACNAMETLLIHKDLIRPPFFESLIDLLRLEKVNVYSGPCLSVMIPFPPPSATSLLVEYGDLQCAIEVVDNVQDAIEHINKFSSNHTDSIVKENQNAANDFLSKVDSTCVFHNVSTRFSDGYRFGLGAEVGISTGRIHSRGSVGIEGHGDVVADFNEGRKKFVHE
ncbi:unnamed protein product [Rotaria sp. Silwood1]|nr:unnamed protein product [Rotaria sp. Silwood1]CAF3422828.1 unnamed protein product [Rotaria sp. Silwood1]CAF3434459.1 unnamed protein product [Rotaria sp. Silwood1]CAF4600398.1 unnamed protein product [Rotaria sp. Silwood1]CAF4657450.1 unnamed protein product [Rotaria sp. Silwood1]